MKNKPRSRPVVFTSNRDWFKQVLALYESRTDFYLEDDAKLGIDPRMQSAIEMGVHGGLTTKEIAGICLSLGLGGFGVAMILAAIVDPEPTSSLALLIGGGIGFIAAGGFSTMRFLMKGTPTNISIGKSGFHIGWTDPPDKYQNINNYGGMPPPGGYYDGTQNRPPPWRDDPRY